MAAGRILLPNFLPAIDANGDPISGAKLYFYLDGTTDLESVYTSSALTTELTNPVVANSAGVFASIWADTATDFTVVATESDGTPLAGGSYTGVSAAVDAALASAAIAEFAQAAAEAAQAAAEAAADGIEAAEAAAAASAVAADASADAAAASAAAAAEISGFNPSLYQLRSEEGVALGYAGLDASGLIPDAHLTGAPVSTDQQAALDLKLSISAATALIRTEAIGIAVAMASAI